MTIVSPLDESEEVRWLASSEERQKAFEDIVNQYSEQLYWKIRSIVLTHDDADDVLQNTLLKAWKGLDNFQGKSQLSTWLYRIAINESLAFLRCKRSEVIAGAEAEMHIASELLADEYFDGDKGQALLQEAIATLPDVQRMVFTLHYFDEMKYSDMSDLLGTSIGALKASYHIAVEKITAIMKRYE